MTATSFFNAIQLAQKPAAIGFVTILALGITTTLATTISALLALLIPVCLIATKAAILGYPLFLAGLIATKIKQNQPKETPAIPLLPPLKPCLEQETIENEVLITPPSAEAIFDYYLSPKQPNWQQPIVKQIQLLAEIQNTSQLAQTPTRLELDTTSRHYTKSLNNQFALLAICWQAIGETATLLDAIKASEMKSIASQLKIPRYRSLNKTQLLLEIVEAHESAPAFSE
jgi:hypothetical protein